MSALTHDWVVGEVGFGPNFAPEAEFLRAECQQHELEIKGLRSEVAELIRQRNRLRRVLQKCAALSPEISDEKHEALLQTDPNNFLLNREKLLP